MAPVRPTKRRKISSNLASEDSIALNDSTEPISIDSALLGHASQWDLEQDYAQKATKRVQVKPNTRLPIKTPEGQVEQLEDLSYSTPESSDLADDSEPGSDDSPDHLRPQHEETEVPPWKAVLDAKESLAKVAGQIRENPEENVAGLKKLHQLGTSKQSTIKKLALATQATVYRDLIPGYRIRSLTKIEEHEKLTKEVRQLRMFEQSLLSAYQKYLQELATCAKLQADSDNVSSINLASTAVSCACTLLLAVPHFNFREVLLAIVIGRLGHSHKNKDFQRCIDTLETLFHDDEDGTPSFDAVNLLAKMIKSRHFRVDEGTVNTFLSLRLLSEFPSKASQTRVDHHMGSKEARKQGYKLKKEFRTKKQRKAIREQKEGEKEFREADAIVDLEHRERMQAETLKLVFGLYFRILKSEDSRLTGAVLEGLGKYAHLVNQDFFADILEVLRQIIQEIDVVRRTGWDCQDGIHADPHGETHPNTSRSILLCVNTAFALLEGQDVAKSASSIGLDPIFFINALHKTLCDLSMEPDIEASATAFGSVYPRGALPSEGSGQSQSRKVKVNARTTATLLFRALSSVMSTRTKQPLPEKTDLAQLKLLASVAIAHKRRLVGLWNTDETRSDGLFDPLGADVEASNPFATSVWEGELLKHHYCPEVRRAIKEIEDVMRNVS